MASCLGGLSTGVRFLFRSVRRLLRFLQRGRRGGKHGAQRGSRRRGRIMRVYGLVSGRYFCFAYLKMGPNGCPNGFVNDNDEGVPSARRRKNGPGQDRFVCRQRAGKQRDCLARYVGGVGSYRPSSARFRAQLNVFRSGTGGRMSREWGWRPGDLLNE